MPTATIAIIGGGFCGTVLAANLLRRPPAGPTRILLIERHRGLGGVAYRPSAFPYLLNVPAARMSATSCEPAQWIEFARRSVPGADGEAYLPRQLYGEYLRDLLHSAQRAAPLHVHLERIRGEVSAVRPPHAAGPMLIQIDQKQRLADQVVLACGDPPPVPKPYAAAVADLPSYVLDPYAAQTSLVRPSDRSVLLIGTGLTMVDVAVAAAAGNPKLQLLAISRHGLLPASQQPPPLASVDPQVDLCGQLDGRSLRRVVPAVRRLAQDLQHRGGDWREAVLRIRECAPALWQQFNEADRRRFLRHLRVYWDTHRHRMPPAVAEQVSGMRRRDQLQVRAGHVSALRPQADGIAVRWRARGCADMRELRVDRVIDCSGADHRLPRTGAVLWRQLLDAGLVVPDSLGLGLRTGAQGALVAADGRTATRLFYLGPMLRAAHWEATAVGELRVRAEALAAALANHTVRESSHDTRLIDSERLLV